MNVLTSFCASVSPNAGAGSSSKRGKPSAKCLLRWSRFLKGVHNIVKCKLKHHCQGYSSVRNSRLSHRPRSHNAFSPAQSAAAIGDEIAHQLRFIQTADDRRCSASIALDAPILCAEGAIFPAIARYLPLAVDDHQCADRNDAFQPIATGLETVEFIQQESFS